MSQEFTMPHRRRRSLVLCTLLALTGSFLSACDSTLAPERTVKAAPNVVPQEPCSTDPQGACPNEPVECSLASGARATGAPLEPVCLSPVTGEPEPCPPLTERIVFSSGAELESHLSTLYDASEDQ